MIGWTSEAEYVCINPASHPAAISAHARHEARAHEDEREGRKAAKARDVARAAIVVGRCRRDSASRRMSAWPGGLSVLGMRSPGRASTSSGASSASGYRGSLEDRQAPGVSACAFCAAGTAGLLDPGRERGGWMQALIERARLGKTITAWRFLLRRGMRAGTPIGWRAR
jgi:hypothetical protein